MNAADELKRHLGLPGALMLGLGSMLGTGVFVSIGLAAGVAGPAVVPAIMLAAVLALCNAFSSAQLAAAFPVSGGTYTYANRLLNPWLGFSAGWLFLLAKSASAATAALGFGGYLLHSLGLSALPVRLPAFLLITLMTLLVAGGVKRTHWVNVGIVSLTLSSLLIFVLAAGPGFLLPENLSLRPADFLSRGFFEACALMFVAYTGYGRIATLGEEIREPRRNIPRAIVTAMAVISSVYLAVAVAAVGSVGAETLGKMTRDTAAPLESVLQLIGRVEAARWVSLGALAAMLGVLLNLLQGLSRVLLAMGREGDMPEGFARLHGGNPRTAVIGVGVLISLLAAVGDIRLSWSFSAFTVLIYYALTNLSALQLPQRDRRYPRGFAWAGLAGCLLLAFQVDRRAWLAGTALIAAGLLIRSMKNRWLSGRAPSGRGR